VTPGQIRELRELVGDPQLLAQRFDSASSMMQHAGEFYEIISQWMSARDFQEAWNALIKTSIPAGPVNTVQDVINDPHIKERGSVLTVMNADGKPLVMPAATPRIGTEMHKPRWVGEPLGASNAHVYSSLLGLSDEDLSRLAARGVI
jgi:crotonobetainyl-CoA:carnitine CoA-transferase CaiB-like acyl-CoA transferase